MSDRTYLYSTVRVQHECATHKLYIIEQFNNDTTVADDCYIIFHTEKIDIRKEFSSIIAAASSTVLQY
jgi:hypothetical protein